MAVGSVVGGDILFFWVILMATELVFVAKLWWKVMSVFEVCQRERERKKLRGKRDGREVRELNFLYYLLIYFILF